MYVYRKVVRSRGPYNKDYEYRNSRGSKITNKDILEYIKSLKIPPAYEDVKINLNKNAKLLVTGHDIKGKKQYMYNPKWVEMRSKEKFCNMVEFGKKLPKITRDINSLLMIRGYSKNKMVAVIIKIIMLCHFRIGNPIGKDVYNSYGVSTLNKTHIIDKGGYVILKFRGKRGVENECTIRDRKIVDILLDLKKKAKNKDEQLFYCNNNDRKIYISSLDVNNYLKQYGNITTKDFRTWYANIYFIRGIEEKGSIPQTITDRRKNVRDTIKMVAEKLHHTVAISKKKYIDNSLMDMYIEHPRKFKKIVLDNYKNNGIYDKASNAFMRYMKSIC